MQTCCGEEQARELNCVVVERRPLVNDNGESGGEFIVYRCVVCGRKHYVHEVAPIAVGVKLDDSP